MKDKNEEKFNEYKQFGWFLDENSVLWNTDEIRLRFLSKLFVRVGRVTEKLVISTVLLNLRSSRWSIRKFTCLRLWLIKIRPGWKFARKDGVTKFSKYFFQWASLKILKFHNQINDCNSSKKKYETVKSEKKWIWNRWRNGKFVQLFRNSLYGWFTNSLLDLWIGKKLSIQSSKYCHESNVSSLLSPEWRSI